MNQLADTLGDVCRRRLLEPKWLLAPARRVGQQWLDTVTRGGQPIANVRIQTLRSLALELAGPELARRGLQFLSPLGGELLVDRLWNRLRAGRSGYLTRLNPTPRFAQTLFRAVQSVRLAGLTEGELRPDRFETPLKGEELIALVSAYREHLAGSRLADAADVLQMALGRLREPGALPPGLVVLLPGDLAPGGLEQDLLDALAAAGCVVRLSVDEPAVASPAPRRAAGAPLPTLFDDAPQSDLELLRYLGQASPAAPRGDGTATIFRALGEANEVRAVYRRVLASGRPLDQVEVLYTDPATYVSLFFELAPRCAEPDLPNQNPPITIQEGIPARYSRPGRALVLWLRWVGEGFPQRLLVRMLADGLVAWPRGPKPKEGMTRLAESLASLPIGQGRERYRPAIETELARLGQMLRTQTVCDDPDEPEPKPDSLHRRLRRLKLLRRLLKALFDVCDQLGPAPEAALRAARRFLAELARSTSELDNYARQRMLEMLDELAHWLGPAEVPTSFDAWGWLESLPAECGIEGSGPRPGCLHLASVGAGGHSGRPLTFAVGLDDGRFPGLGLQDPLLLDGERERLSPRLPTAAGQRAEKLDAFRRLLARLRGQVILSYPCRSITDDRELFPSPVLLAAYRLLSGNSAGDRTDLERWAGAPVAFAPAKPSGALSETEWWLASLAARPDGVLAEGAWRTRFPHLSRGAAAAVARSSSAFTAFDGCLGPGFAELDPFDPAGPVLSAGRLETAAQCPLRYFMRHVLAVEPAEEPTAADRWLDPLELGDLLHRAFEDFLRQLMQEGTVPEASRDEPRILRILASKVDEFRRAVPPPSENAYQVQLRQLEETARIFVREESDYYRKTGSRPVCIEATIGMPADGHGSLLDDSEPVAIELAGGRTIRLRGRIDRIDRIGTTPEFLLWDYKTGRSDKYTKKRPYYEGRVIQHAAYLALVRQRLRKHFGADARAVQFGYFFPGVRTRGERLVYAAADLADGLAVIDRSARTIANGAFLATTNDDDCAFCEYAPICNPQAGLAAASRQKLDEPANQLLVPLRELRSNGSN